MDDPAVLELLAQSRLFAGLDPAALPGLARIAGLRRVRDGAFFFFQDAPAIRLYLLLSGRVKLTQITPAGQQVLLGVRGTGELVGAVAVLGETVYSASAQALGACMALGWESAAFGVLLEAYPRLALNALRFQAGRIHELQDRYRELATERAEQRIAHALLRLAAQLGRAVAEGVLLDLPLTRQDVAALAGTTLFTASRTLRRWEQQGLVRSGRARVLIRDPDALRRLADPTESSADPLSLR